MRDLLAGILARFQSSNRQQRLIFLLGAILAIFVARYGIAGFVDYREEIKADIRLSAQRLASANRLLEAAPQTERQLGRLRKRYRATVVKLVPGETPTLAAAELQDLVSSLAAKNNVRVQTTQVLKDEAVGSFRQVSLRVTASGTTRELAGLLSMLEFGDLRVKIPYFELTRRGGSSRRRRNKNVSRSASVTFQVTGIIAGSAKLLEGIAAVRVAKGAVAAQPEPLAKASPQKVPAAAKSRAPQVEGAKAGAGQGGAAKAGRDKRPGRKSAKGKRPGDGLAPSAAWLRDEDGKRPRWSGIPSVPGRRGEAAGSTSSLVGGAGQSGSLKETDQSGAGTSGDGLRVSSQ